MFELRSSVPVPPPVFPAGIVARTYEDRDLARLVDVAGASFADHVTPIAFTEEVVSHVNSLPGFDPRGILLLFDRADPDTAIGWAKAKHGVVEATGERRGTVSMVGVRPAWRGRGLGRELLRWAIGYGRNAGAATIELYVEAANDGAKQLYLASGFEPVVEWPGYVLPTGA
jgi:mycothiol synthase